MPTETVLRTTGVYTTLLGALNQFQAFTALAYQAMENTTLNYKYANLEGASGVVHFPVPPTTPALSYFGIGVRGFINIGDYSSVPYPGDARMMDLYQPIPIRCVRLDEEASIMSKEERSKYRLRVVRVINDVEYALYYLKMIEFDPVISIVSKDTDGTETPFVPSEAWLNPNPPAINETGGLIDTTINRLIVRATGVCTVTHDEVMEAVNVLYNGDTNYAKISEVGYYTGCDVDVTSDWVYTEDEDSAAYKEAVYVQLAKGHCYRGSELVTAGSYIKPVVTLESETCINGALV